MWTDSGSACRLTGRRTHRDAGRTPTLSDIFAIPEPPPKRRRGRPIDPAMRERRALAARLVEDGTITRQQAQTLVGHTKQCVNRWVAAHRRRSA